MPHPRFKLVKDHPGSRFYYVIERATGRRAGEVYRLMRNNRWGWSTLSHPCNYDCRSRKEALEKLCESLIDSRVCLKYSVVLAEGANPVECRRSIVIVDPSGNTLSQVKVLSRGHTISREFLDFVVVLHGFTRGHIYRISSIKPCLGATETTVRVGRFK